MMLALFWFLISLFWLFEEEWRAVLRSPAVEAMALLQSLQECEFVVLRGERQAAAGVVAALPKYRFFTALVQTWFAQSAQWGSDFSSLVPLKQALQLAVQQERTARALVSNIAFHYLLVALATWLWVVMVGRQWATQFSSAQLLIVAGSQLAGVGLSILLARWWPQRGAHHLELLWHYYCQVLLLLPVANQPIPVLNLAPVSTMEKQLVSTMRTLVQRMEWSGERLLGPWQQLAAPLEMLTQTRFEHYRHRLMVIKYSVLFLCFLLPYVWLLATLFGSALRPL